MKKKELLQKSSTVAAVVLAAALMDPTAAQASAMDASAVSSSSQVLEQSVSSNSENAVETETAESQDTADETDSNIPDTPDAEPSPETSASSDTDTAETASDDISDASAVSTQDDFTPGWNTDDDGNVSYRDENGVWYQDEIREIDGKKYYFNEHGYLVKDTEFSYDTSDYTSHTFRAQEDGSLLIDGWYDKSYFDENGYKCYYCVKKINGAYYGFDNDGNMFVADYGNHCIRMISADNIVTTVAGHPGVAGYKDGGPVESLFKNPWGVAVNEQGDIYIADWGNARIRKLVIE